MATDAPEPIVASGSEHRFGTGSSRFGQPLPKAARDAPAVVHLEAAVGRPCDGPPPLDIAGEVRAIEPDDLSTLARLESQPGVVLTFSVADGADADALRRATELILPPALGLGYDTFIEIVDGEAAPTMRVGFKSSVSLPARLAVQAAALRDHGGTSVRLCATQSLAGILEAGAGALTSLRASAVVHMTAAMTMASVPTEAWKAMGLVTGWATAHAPAAVRSLPRGTGLSVVQPDLTSLLRLVAGKARGRRLAAALSALDLRAIADAVTAVLGRRAEAADKATPSGASLAAWALLAGSAGALQSAAVVPVSGVVVSLECRGLENPVCGRLGPGAEASPLPDAAAVRSMIAPFAAFLEGLPGSVEDAERAALAQVRLAGGGGTGAEAE